jgi:uncharacterized protein YqiB (DUF1249 family)
MIVKNKKTEAFEPRPRSFIHLMDMYESNYIRLRLFCGDIRQLPDETISSVPGGVPVRLTVLERASQTTLLMLTYLFDDEQKRPNLKIQVYHDSRQADVISRNCRITGREMRLWEEKIDSVLLCRWRLNRFLYKWLGYLDHQGHDFKVK